MVAAFLAWAVFFGYREGVITARDAIIEKLKKDNHHGR
jgi:hypothetical protein